MVIAHLLQAQVAFDEFSKLDCITCIVQLLNNLNVQWEMRTWFSGIRHGKMRAEDFDFILVTFHFYDGA